MQTPLLVSIILVILLAGAFLIVTFNKGRWPFSKSPNIGFLARPIFTNSPTEVLPEEIFGLMESILNYGSFLKNHDKRKIKSLLELRQFYRAFVKTQNLRASEILELLNEAADKLREFNLIIGLYVSHINELQNQITDLRKRHLIEEKEYQQLQQTNLKYEQTIQGLVQTQMIVLAQQAAGWIKRYNLMKKKL